MAGWLSGLRRCGLITVRLLGSSAWVRIPLLPKIFDLYQQMHKTDSVISWRLAHLQIMLQIMLLYLFTSFLMIFFAYFQGNTEYGEFKKMVLSGNLFAFCAAETVLMLDPCRSLPTLRSFSSSASYRFLSAFLCFLHDYDSIYISQN